MNGRALLDDSMSERQWMELVLDTARAHGFRCYHTHDSRRSERGFPDVFCAREGSGAIAIECKAQRGRIKAEQREWIALMQSVGIRALVARPSDWEMVEQMFKGEA